MVEVLVLLALGCFAASMIVATRGRSAKPTGAAQASTFTVEAHESPDLEHPRLLFFDIETQRGSSEVGWANIDQMGVALAVLWDEIDQKFYTYRENQIAALVTHLLKGDLVIGFNSIKFDYIVLSGYTHFAPDRVFPTFDLFAGVPRSGKLDTLAKETLGESKSADGLQSLRWYRDGRFDLIEEYCKSDVSILRRLFYHGLNEGYLWTRKRGATRRTRIPLDWNIRSLVQTAWARIPDRTS